MNVFRIFRRDLRRLGKNALALVIIAGVTLLPALYAWFNIAANWDPYGNTGNLKVAVACEDAGAEFEGAAVNFGDDVITNLKGNDEIGWQFVTRTQALEGVKAGDYYACLILPEDFSEKMISVLSGDIQRPKIEYYVNEKKNAIAPKITKSGVSAVQQEINESFLEEVTEALMTTLNLFSEEDGDYLSDRLLSRLRQAEGDLDTVATSLDIFQNLTSSAGQLNQGVKALLPTADGTVNQGLTAVNSLNTLLTASHDAAQQTSDAVKLILDSAMETFDQAADDGTDLLQRLENLDFNIEQSQKDLTTLSGQLNTMAGDLDDAADRLAEIADTDAVEDAGDTMRDLADDLASVQTNLNKLAKGVGDLPDTTALRQKLLALGTRAGELSDTLAPLIQDLEDRLESASESQLLLLKAELAALTQAKTAADRIAGVLSADSLPDLHATAQSVRQELESLAGQMSSGKTTLNQLADLMDGLPGDLSDLSDGLTHLADFLETSADVVNQVVDALDQAKDLPTGLTDQLQELKNQADTSYQSAKDALDGARPAIDTAVDEAYDTLDSVTGLLTQFSSLLPQTQTVLSNVDGAIVSLTKALTSAKDLVVAAQEDLQNVIDDMEDLTASETVQELRDMLQSDPATVAQFMSAPVEVETTSYYPIETYGSGMAPFYSVLACWVGSIVLVAILKVDVDEDEQIHHLKPWESYFGRYLLFLMLGVAQSIIICLGDLYFLGVQCTSVPLFLLAGAVCGIVFGLISYTLTVSFRDVGKAVTVILLVVQIGGSGGTFPIEVTPVFFQKVYPILPFTHAINAMREIVAGQYGYDYWLDLLKLLVYIPLALLLGLVLRKPLIRMNEFFEERLKSTKLM